MLAEILANPFDAPLEEMRVETGTASLSDPGNASDDTWGTSTSSQSSVTFTEEFSEAPIVHVTVQEAVGDRGQADVANITTTGCDINWRVFKSSGSYGPNVAWVAIGPA